MKVLLIALLMIAVTSPLLAQSVTTTAHEPDGSFVHTVYFWLQNPESDADRMELYRGLVSLKDIPQIQRAYIGVPAPTERGVIDNTYDFSLTFIFEDQAAEQAYQVHPIHQEFVENYAHLWDRVIVYDAMAPEW